MAFNLGGNAGVVPDRGWKLYVCAVAMVVVSGLFVAARVAARFAKKGLGMDDYTIIAALWFYAAQVTYKMVITFNKLSILYLYLRIFIDQTFRRMCYLGIAFTASTSIAYILATIFQCTPISAFWDKTIRDRHCINSEAFWISYSALNIATDFFVLALPIRQIMHLQLPRVDKFTLAGVFLLGAL
ncbi:hypothetical protein LTR04_007348 [Oleoguttula sp. CCFEE 6159]|nr:hypothetical protein LTR04_007348 [Oleoguttula sp. CCFEE 6159]